MKHSIIYIICMLLATTVVAQEQWSLRQCIDYAIAHNIDIKLQENNVRNQEVSLSTAKNSRLPNLQASANESFGFGRGLTIDNTYADRNTQSTSFNLGSDVPLYTGGQISNQIRQNKLNLQAAIADLEKATAIVVNAKTRRVSVCNALDCQKNSAMLALLELSQLLELSTPEQFDILQPEAADPSAIILTAPDAIYAEALNTKPQIRAGKLNVLSAERGVRIAQAGHYPSLHLSAGMGTNYYKTSGFEAASFGKQMEDNFNQSLGIALSIPIFNRYATRNAVRQARLQVEARQFQLEETQKTLYKEIQQAYYNALAAQKQCISSDAALTASRTAFNLMQKKYENGKATATEYQESKTNLQKAETTALQSRYTFMFRRKILQFYQGHSISED